MCRWYLCDWNDKMKLNYQTNIQHLSLYHLIWLWLTFKYCFCFIMYLFVVVQRPTRFFKHLNKITSPVFSYTRSELKLFWARSFQNNMTRWLLKTHTSHWYRIDNPCEISRIYWTNQNTECISVRIFIQ